MNPIIYMTIFGLLALKSRGENPFENIEGRWMEQKCFRDNLAQLLIAFGYTQKIEDCFPDETTSLQNVFKLNEGFRFNGTDPFGNEFDKVFKYKSRRSDQGTFGCLLGQSQYLTSINKNELRVETIFDMGNKLRITRQFMTAFYCQMMEIAYTHMRSNVSGYLYFSRHRGCTLDCKYKNQLLKLFKN